MTEASPAAIPLAKQGAGGLSAAMALIHRHCAGEVILVQAQLCPESSSISRGMQPPTS